MPAKFKTSAAVPETKTQMPTAPHSDTILEVPPVEYEQSDNKAYHEHGDCVKYVVRLPCELHAHVGPRPH